MNLPQTIITNSLQETQKFAQNMASTLNPGTLIFLHGDVGAGKTTFVQGLASGLKSQDPFKIQSPTYNLAFSYPTQPPLHHLDLYRFKDDEISLEYLENLGLLHLIQDHNAITCIEWPFESILDFSFLQKIRIQIDCLESDTRKITVTSA